jgi:hypothetical protein
MERGDACRDRRPHKRKVDFDLAQVVGAACRCILKGNAAPDVRHSCFRNQNRINEALVQSAFVMGVVSGGRAYTSVDRPLDLYKSYLYRSVYNL